MTTIAQYIVQSLENSGVKRLYGLIGDSLNSFGPALSKSNMDWVSVRHEETAAFAAGAEAFVTEELCVCAGTCGPGSIHLINGLYEAKANQCPVLALVTHISSSQMGLEYFQNTHPMKAFEDCSIYCELLTNKSQLPAILSAAMNAAISKKGPAVLIIPGDIAKEQCNALPLQNPKISFPKAMPDILSLEKIKDAINSHKKIMFHCGIGCKNGFDSVLALANKINAPMLWTLRSKYFVEPDNPLAIDCLGLVAFGYGTEALSKCDCLVLLGTDYPFAFIDKLPNNPMIIQIDIDGSHIGRRRSVDLALIGDIKETAEMLTALVLPKDNVFLDEIIAGKQKFFESFNANLKALWQKDVLRPECVTTAISDWADENTTFVVDVGLNDVWINRYITPKKGQQILGSFKYGTMGAGLGYAIALGLACPERNIIYLAADGNLSMLLGDLMTVERHNLPIKIVVYNNHTLGFIDLEASLEGYKPFGTELPNPSFAKIAEAMNIKSVTINKNSQLKDDFIKVLSQQGLVLIDCLTDTSAIST